MAHLRFPENAICRRTDANAPPRLVDPETQHLVLEVLAVSAAPSGRKLPDMRHLMEEKRHQRVDVAACADVQGDGYRAVHSSVHRRRARLGVSRDASPAPASVQEQRHWRERPAPPPGIAEVVAPVQLAVDVLAGPRPSPPPASPPLSTPPCPLLSLSVTRRDKHRPCQLRTAVCHLPRGSNDFGQNFANHLMGPNGRGNFSFRENCASASCIVLKRPFHAKLRWW